MKVRRETVAALARVRSWLILRRDVERRRADIYPKKILGRNKEVWIASADTAFYRMNSKASASLRQLFRQRNGVGSRM